MDSQTRYEKTASLTMEIVTSDELRNVFETKQRPRAYIGFEPSGRVHIGWLLCARKIKDMIESGIDVTILLADWHAFINDKMGGNIDNIQTTGKYMEDCFEALGVPRDKVNYVYASTLISDGTYWEKVLRVAKATSVARTKRALTIMGRSEAEADSDLSKLIYPAMQVADIFHLDVDIAYGGMDQRKAHMLGRDAADKLGWGKFVALHTPLIPGLVGGERMDPLEAKMSKSNPDSCLYIHDTHDEIKRKINKAYCPNKTENNPIAELYRLLIFPHFDSVVIKRPEKWGGDMEFDSYEKISEPFNAGQLHPADFKAGAIEYISQLLAPVEEYFKKNSKTYEAVKNLKITR